MNHRQQYSGKLTISLREEQIHLSVANPYNIVLHLEAMTSKIPKQTLSISFAKQQQKLTYRLQHKDCHSCNHFQNHESHIIVPHVFLAYNKFHCCLIVAPIFWTLGNGSRGNLSPPTTPRLYSLRSLPKHSLVRRSDITSKSLSEILYKHLFLLVHLRSHLKISVVLCYLFFVQRTT